jgi:hypothetical protein
MDPKKLDQEMVELFAVAGFRGSVPQSGNTHVTTAETRELYRELKRFLFSKEFAEFEGKHIPPESYMAEFEETYKRFAGIVESPTKQTKSGNPVVQVLVDCGKFVDAHPLAKEFAGLERTDAINRAFYLYSINGQAFPILTFSEGEHNAV